MATVEYKCPNCSAPLRFDATNTNIVCDFCESTFAPGDLEKETDAITHNASRIDDEYMAGEKAESYWQEVMSKTAGYVCPSCSGSIIGTDVSAALFCPYCGNPAIIESSLEGEFRPDYVIPFAKTKEDAVETYKKFSGKHFLLPKEFAEENVVEKISGVYVPYHLLSCGANGNIMLRCEEKTKSWEDDDYEYQEYDVYNVKRAGRMAFEKVPCNASKSIDDAFMESIEPYNYEEGLKDFDVSYLVGFLADKYDVTAEEVSGKLESRVNNSMKKALTDTVTGYTSTTEISSSCGCENKSFSYALFPVWLIRTKFKDKMYYFAMNGQTGAYAGRLPVNQTKRWLTSLGIGALTGILLGLLNVAVGIFLGMVAFFIPFFAMPAKLKRVNTRTMAAGYESEPLDLTYKTDTYIRTRTEKTRKNN